MNNIKILKKGIDVSSVLNNLKNNMDDWGIQKENAESLIDRGYDDIPVGNLQLVIGVVKNKKDHVGDSEINVPTAAYQRHTEVVEIVKKEIPNREIHRWGFLSLPVDGYVGAHIDEGTYYHTRDRYHLSIQGQYQYFVGDETIIIDPGTLFWFNNKKPPGAVNLGDDVRVTFVFDMPHEDKILDRKVVLRDW